MVHLGGHPLRIHLLHRRCECQQQGSLLLGALLQAGDELQVGFYRAGILLQIFLVVELDGVHKEAHHHHVVLFQGTLDEREMPFVQGTHGGHQAYAPATCLGFGHRRLQVGGFLYLFHCFVGCIQSSTIPFP